MLRYKTKLDLALYDIRPGNGAGLFLQPRTPHGARRRQALVIIAAAPFWIHQWHSHKCGCTLYRSVNLLHCNVTKFQNLCRAT